MYLTSTLKVLEPLSAFVSLPEEKNLVQMILYLSEDEKLRFTKRARKQLLKSSQLGRIVVVDHLDNTVPTKLS